jgi:hypothetical protein
LPLGFAELAGAADYSVEFAEYFALLINQQFRVTHNIDEQNMPDLQTRLFFGGHLREMKHLIFASGVERINIDNLAW